MAKTALRRIVGMFGLILVAFLAIGAGQASADNVNFSFVYPGEGHNGPTAGQTNGLVGDADDVWNKTSAADPFSIGLVDTDGNTLDGVTLTSDVTLSWFSNTNYSAPYEMFKVVGFSKAVSEGGAGPVTMTISDPEGVLAGKTFELYLYHAYDLDNVAYAYDRFQGTYTVNGESKTGGSDPASTFVVGGNYNVFSNVVTSESGEIVVVWEPLNDGAINAVLNGFQLVEVPAVPEPGSLTLLASGVLMLICRKSRRQNDQ